MRTPLGYERCAGCAALSALYVQFPACVECGDHFCADCMPGASEPDEGHWGRGTCARCAEE